MWKGCPHTVQESSYLPPHWEVLPGVFSSFLRWEGASVLVNVPSQCPTYISFFPSRNWTYIKLQNAWFCSPGVPLTASAGPLLLSAVEELVCKGNKCIWRRDVLSELWTDWTYTWETPGSPPGPPKYKSSCLLSFHLHQTMTCYTSLQSLLCKLSLPKGLRPRSGANSTAATPDTENKPPLYKKHWWRPGFSSSAFRNKGNLFLSPWGVQIFIGRVNRQLYSTPTGEH